MREVTRQRSREFERDLVKNIKKNPKAFWKYANSKLKTRSKLGELK